MNTLAPTVFSLSPEQASIARAWLSEHPCNEVAVRSQLRAISYSFTPGVSTKVHCSGCNSSCAL